MNTAQTAIVVSGAVGLGTPIVSQIFERLREKRRFDHERDLRDRDALRLRLDAVADALDIADRAIRAAFGLLVQHGPKNDVLHRPVADGFRAVHDARLVVARLGLWIPLDEGPGQAASETLQALDYVISAIDIQNALRRYTDDFSFDDLGARQSEAAQASGRFLHEARKRYGAR